MFNNFHKKEKPFTGMSGLGGGFLRFKSGSGFAVSGGTLVPAGIEPGNGYKYHVFTSPGNLEVTGKAGTVEFLIVAGGGGPINGSGGGGGGGVLHHPGREFDVGTHPVTVGAGGPNTEGADSVLVDANGPTTWTATGGGKSNMRSAGTAGGSGGGGLSTYCYILFHFASMASTRHPVTVTPSTRPHERPLRDDDPQLLQHEEHQHQVRPEARVVAERALVEPQRPFRRENFGDRVAGVAVARLAGGLVV